MTAGERKNPFPGINPHLNSFLQQPDGGWESFHSSHISDITHHLDTILPARYYAVQEKSLQILTLNDELSVRRAEYTIPDISVYRLQETENRPASASPAAPVLTFPVIETFAEEDDLQAVMIYRIVEGKVPGIRVTRIEFLSPGNKRGGRHHRHYLAKRQDTLKTGLKLVEIDYLHETHPALQKLPSYKDHEAGAFPYWIVVSNPDPDPYTGSTQVYGFGVADVLLPVSVPLAENESVLLDAGSVYHQTFASTRVWSLLTDYTQPPVNFDRYHTSDRAWILQHSANLA